MTRRNEVPREAHDVTTFMLSAYVLTTERKGTLAVRFYDHKYELQKLLEESPVTYPWVGIEDVMSCVRTLGLAEWTNDSVYYLHVSPRTAKVFLDRQGVTEDVAREFGAKLVGLFE